jgi:hypothetical protein
VTNRWCLPFRALRLPSGGAGHAATAGSVLTTDESFTVTAWVRLESIDGFQTVVSQGGVEAPAMVLQATPEGRWRFAMAEQDSSSTDWAVVESADDTAQVDEWTHLAGVFDLARGQMQLFVDGEFIATAEGPAAPWHADGPLYVGVTGLDGGGTSQRLHGTVDEVTIWSSTLDPDRIVNKSAQRLEVPCFFF